MLLNNCGEMIAEKDIFHAASELLKKGKIISVKGLGGFHLVCDAKNADAISCLRNRKNRPEKPLAIMAKNFDLVSKICEVNEIEKKIITSDRRPIILLKKNVNYNLPKNLTPGVNTVGIMLPYTYIHNSLFEEGLDYLVMTSGNMSSTPIQYKNSEAINTLSGIADFFILHDSNIKVPLEDSIVKVIEDSESMVRIGRGYAPIKIEIDNTKSIVGLGAEQKSTFCISQDGYAYISQYFGDLKFKDAFRAYSKGLSKLMYKLNSNPKVIAFDMHPSYINSQYAEKMEGLKVPIQHHHAHMVSCMVEHNIYHKVLGVIYDGTGFGTDGALWGGELIIGDRDDFIRAGHFKYVSIQGGDQSIKEPWRTAVSYLYTMGVDAKDYIKGLSSNDLEMVVLALKNNINCYKSSSIGRLFDCISSLLGICHVINYDAQGAILLENIIDENEEGSYGYKIENTNGCFEIDYK